MDKKLKTLSYHLNIKDLHPNLKLFVEQSYEILDKNNIMKRTTGGYAPFVLLVYYFCILDIEFDNTLVEDEYKLVKKVRDLPKKDLEECLMYLSHIMGVSKHTGGHCFINIYYKEVKPILDKKYGSNTIGNGV